MVRGGPADLDACPCRVVDEDRRDIAVGSDVAGGSLQRDAVSVTVGPRAEDASIGFCDLDVVDARLSSPHQPVVRELPVLVAVGTPPCENVFKQWDKYNARSGTSTCITPGQISNLGHFAMHSSCSDQRFLKVSQTAYMSQTR